MYKALLGVAPHLVLVLLALTSLKRVSAQEGDNVVCASCHEEIVKKISTTAHSVNACVKCHAKHEDYPHPANVPKPVCASCHTDESAAFTRSVHAEVARAGNAGAPDCNVCHASAHEVQRTDT